MARRNAGAHFVLGVLLHSLDLEQMEERFAEIVNELKRRLDGIGTAGAPVSRHFLASILYGGVTVRMYKEENHQRPHVHVYYGKKNSVSIAVDNGGS